MEQNLDEKMYAIDQKQKDKFPLTNQISQDFEDDTHIYRIIRLGRESVRLMQEFKWEKKLLKEEEWRRLRVYQRRGWLHYAIFEKEPYVLLFKRKITKNKRS
ncbi:unnamed protein product (macronuclear) [Paramecium tetraurelia]|uniref:Cyclin-dependent kinases regulatory subunit n=1 Tax=Paramecium tetraurelia TaxID=5888 RepID=A0BH22_PARTE|nr:uncharacterized protein GSPATT00028874001 [Paramecium tetraurelia]CAK57839.1 unnamed protein product [Paramecium tetraurelia]|eukprot:XP_001425237.1 hypothetical protein (macronuclear) [Paramecium tetraurelia strain d4-2]